MTTGKITPSHNRRINKKSYWLSSTELMLDTYLNKPESVVEKESLKYDKICSYIDELNPKSVLEIGCGFGYTLKKIHQRLPHLDIYGCDFAPNLVSQAKKYLKGTVSSKNIKVADVTQLSNYYGKQFDLILTHGCLMCLTTVQLYQALREIQSLAQNLIFIEADYSKYDFMNKLRFQKEKGYPINDYLSALKALNFSIITIDNSLSAHDEITNPTFFVCSST